ncbi:MAG: putative N6-adenine-specific methylase [Bacteroidetes bacterium]|nr:putative N6-adenine-specific methylase [Bacteroidota bacterium]MDF2452250.1 putative N6-adenine-specific methylase [Bacteroidota bacterium]
MKDKKNTEHDFEMKATTFHGLEDVLVNELMKLGARDIVPFKRGVSFTGDKGFMYKANLCLRTALKVLVPIYSFTANNENELYEKMKEYEWEELLNTDDTLAINATVNSDEFNHSLYVSQKTKDAICDRFVDKFSVRPNVDLDRPTVRIYVHIFRNQVNVSLDSSGDSLFKRGYRVDIDTAPMKEVLAAGMVLLSGWQPHLPLIDGMCGSGTLGIEAALFANNIPPGVFREEFGFMKWHDYDKELWDTIYESCINRIKDDMPTIISSDIDIVPLEMAKRNGAVAKVEDVIQYEHKSFFDMMPTKPHGTILLNPPYDERLKMEDTNAFYKQIGDKLKKDFGGWTCWIISSNMEAIKSIGLHPSKKMTLFNASLECKLLKYEMYGGSKKASKQGKTNTEAE